MRREQASVLLRSRLVEKPWGVDRLPAPFTAPAGRRIGEIWFEPPPELPQILVKYLFTQESLSIQVHPSDTPVDAEGRQGKDECWLVVAADPGARLGIGFRQPLDAATMRAAAADGSIEKLVDWHTVRAGDIRYLPAGTVHAIGGGLCILEIQQNVDITYRLYDYGRPRDLHVDQAVNVARTAPHDPAHRFHRPGGSGRLVDGPVFTLDQWIGEGPSEAATGPLLVMPLQGAVTVAGQRVDPGQCALAMTGADVIVPEHAQCLTAQPAPAPAADG